MVMVNNTKVTWRYIYEHVLFILVPKIVAYILSYLYANFIA